MRSPAFSVSVVLVVVSCGAACGGKIAEEPNGGPGSSSSSSSSSSGGSGSSSSSGAPAVPSPAPSETPPAPPPDPTGKNLSLDEACVAICERNAKCGADKVDCYDDCVSEGRSSTCGAEATAYRQCHGSHIEESSCAVLPPVCEAAYCAYTRCTGIYTPSYCF